MQKHGFLPFAFLCLTATVLADQKAITIDGLYDDWNGVPIAVTDAEGEVSGGNVDFGSMWLADDDRFLFIRLEFGVQFDPSENNGVRLIIDGGNGRELEWRLGSRQGTFRVNGSATDSNVRYTDIGFRGIPTIEATEFEFAVSLDARPDGSNLLFTSSSVVVRFEDTIGGDRIPGTGDGVVYTLGEGSLPSETLIDLGKDKTTDLRVVTYNVLNDNLFNSGQQPRFRRQLQAVVPDIINFQEIRSYSPETVRSLIESWLPLGDGEDWYAAGGVTSNNDTITVSRFPVLGKWDLFGSNTTTGNIAVLLDTQSRIGYRLLVINAHLPCCGNDFTRQQETDEIMAFIRDAKSPGGAVDLDLNTPVIITGDMNFVGLPRQLTTFLTGDISDESTFGSDFTPDWDGSDLFNIISRHTDQRMGYTWRDDPGNNFWPGHLDYVIFSDSVLEVPNNYILYTPAMSASRLSEYGLQSSDSYASDHILFVADFRPGFVDSDGNSLPDYWENLKFGAIGTTTATADSDRDGAPNIEEYWAGTDPLDRTSRFLITQYSLAEGQVMVNWSSVVDKRYVVEISSDLNSWIATSALIDGNGNEMSRVVSFDEQDDTRLFYRVRVQD